MNQGKFLFLFLFFSFFLSIYPDYLYLLLFFFFRPKADAQQGNQVQQNLLYNFTIVYPPHLASTFPIHLSAWTPEPLFNSPQYSSNANKNFCPLYKLTAPKDIFGCKPYNQDEFLLDEQYLSYPESTNFNDVSFFFSLLTSYYLYFFISLFL